jgi:adenine/guanine phosphoribosyltransferase-like PRPP-binding protein
MKENIYNHTLDLLNSELDKVLQKANKKCCLVIDFNSCWDKDHNVAKKIIMFLVLDNRINREANVVIINPPPKEIIQVIKGQLMHLPEEVIQLTQQPTPCIYYEKKTYEIIWIGINEEKTYEKVGEVLINEIYSVAKSDFENESKAIDTGLMKFDTYGNATRFYDMEQIKIRAMLEDSQQNENENVIYLCSGNYYQDKYLGLIEQFYNRDDLDIYSNLLHRKLERSGLIKLEDVTHILSVTLSSQILARQFINDITDEDIKSKLKKNFKRLSNYHSYYLESEFRDIKPDDSIVVICDVISTGYLIKSLSTKIEKIGAKLIGVIAICDTRDKSSNYYHPDPNDVHVLCLDKMPMRKFRYKDEPKKIKDCKEIIRINPASNAPITMSIEKTEPDKILMANGEFLDIIVDINEPNKYLKRGYFVHHNLFYPYYFKTRDIFNPENEVGIKLLKESIKKIKEQNAHIDDINFIFYPVSSGIEEIDTNQYESEVFLNKDISFIPIGRFKTPNGYRYTFPPKYLNGKTYNKDVLIVDDGSCSGATIIQMIDEISFLDVRSIIVLSVIGRTDDFMREFFARIKLLKVKNLNEEISDRPFKENNEPIPLDIYFVSQWQIQTYGMGAAFPFREEKDLLDYYDEISYLPSFLSAHIDSKKKQLTLYKISDVSKANDLIPNDISITDMLNMRNSIGKIAGYRFYKDYFEEFNIFTKGYYDDPTNRTIRKQIELMLSVLVHEPYLIRPIRDFLPDVYSILKEFIEDIITNYAGKYKRNANLAYTWSCAALLSVYLNLRMEEMNALDDNLFKVGNIDKIICFMEEKDSSEDEDPLPIFFMFILSFVPKKKDEVIQLQSKGITLQTELLDYVTKIQNEQPNKRPICFCQIKIFISFLSIIPYLNKEIGKKTDCIKKIHNFYLEEDADKKHGKSISNLLESIHNQSVDLEYVQTEQEKKKTINRIIELWDQVSGKLSKYLQYMQRIYDFILLNKNGAMFEKILYGGYDFLMIYQKLNDIILKNEIEMNHATIRRYTNENLVNYYFDANSDMVKIFENLTTKNVINEYRNVFPSHIVEIKDANINDLEIQFPKFYFKYTFLEEIKHNFRHAKENTKIESSFEYSNKDYIEISISNTINPDSINGGNHGEKLFEELKSCIDFDYKLERLSDKFLQKFYFKIKQL